MLPDDLSKLRVVDLREELTKRNLPTKGKKDELVARLREAVDNENQSASATNGATEDAKPEAVGDNEEPETNQEEQPPSESAPTDSTPSNAVPTEPAPAEGKESEPANVTTSAAPAAETSNTEETKNELEKEAATQNEEAAHAHTVKEKAQEAPAITTTTTTEGNAAPANEETEQIAHRDSMDTDLERGTKRKHEAAEEKPPNVAVPAEIEQMQDIQAQPAKKVRAKPEDIGKTVDSSALYIKGFLRPLVAKRVKEQLLDKFGTVKKWWMDAIKTHCYVVYESNEEAQKAFAGIDGIEFPKGHGNKLHVEGITPEQTDIIIEQEQAAAEKRQPFDCEAALTLIRQGQILSPTTAAAEVRRPRLLGLSQINRQLQKAATGSEVSPPIAAPAPAPVPPPIPAKPMPALDDLFRKTQAEPQLYYLPVPEEVAQERLSQMRGNRQRA